MPAHEAIQPGQIWRANETGNLYEIVSLVHVGEWWQKMLVAKNVATGVQQQFSYSEWPRWTSRQDSKVKKVCPTCGSIIREKRTKA